MSDTKSSEPNAPLVDVDFEVIPLPSPPVVEADVMDRSEEPDDENLSILVGAGVAGGCVGCFIGGPTLACVAGVASAYGTTRESAAGDATRAMGRLAISCKRKAVDMNEKHHLVDKSKAAAWSCWETSKDLSERHKVLDHTKECVLTSWNGIRDINSKYRIVDRTCEGVTSTCNLISDKIVGEELQNNISEEESVATSLPATDGGESRLPNRGVTTNGTYVAVAGNDES